MSVSIKIPGSDSVIGTADAATGKSKSRWSPETLAKMSAAKKGKPPSPQCQAARIAALTGKPLSTEHRAKISARNKGRPSPLKDRQTVPQSAEAKAKFRETGQKKRGALRVEREAAFAEWLAARPAEEPVG